MRSTTKIGLGAGIVAWVAAYGMACSSTTNNNNTVANTPDGSTPTGPGTGTDGGPSSGEAGAEGGPTGPAKPFHAVTGAGDSERTTSVYCPSATSCVVATDNSDGSSHIYAIDANTVNATPLLTADDAFSTKIGVVGDVAFLGFSKVGTQLIARTDPGGGSWVTASGDPLSAASWTVTTVGHATPDDFALNAQYGFGLKGTTWIQARYSFIYNAAAAPAPATAWTTTWSPGGSPEIPADLASQHTADATVCIAQVGVSFSPRPTQSVYIAADGAIILYPSNGLNQSTDAETGVCISTDGGLHFKRASLPGLAADVDGPTTVTCTSTDHCIVAGGQTSNPNSAYVYVSSNASSGATSTWTKATIPTDTTHDRKPYGLVFAPDGQNGWLVGSVENNSPMLWSTTDGGATWTDQTGTVSTLTDAAIWSGYAFDATHVVLGSDNGKIISNF